MQKIIKSGRCDAVVTWWTLHMYKDIDLTIAPGLRVRSFCVG
jgi:hypothetical protein